VNQETNAAQADPLDAFVQEAIDQDSNETEQVQPSVESATITEEVEEVTPVEAEAKPEHDGFQKRMNKVTAEKYEFKRQLEALQAQQTKAPAEPVKAPTLEAHDYDEEAYNKANIQHLVQQELDRQATVNQVAYAAEDRALAQQEYEANVDLMGKPDFYEKANKLPLFADGVVEALKGSKEGIEMIYYLSDHLDKADSLASLNVNSAMMEIGKLSNVVNKKPEIKLSAAPEPIEPLRAGSAITSDIGGEMSIDAWMSQYN
jgi:hypothetical protein